MAGIIDFHTHAFADNIAERAMTSMCARCSDVKPKLDGTLGTLLKSMDKAGIEKSVICSIATKPKQFEPILEWSGKIASKRIVPFASIHPDDTQLTERIKKVKDAGIKGLKIHPFYQDFCLDEEKMMGYYEKVCEAGLMLVSHTGYDVAFERVRKAEPKRVLNVTARFPELKFITTHLGAWQIWEETEEFLLGKNIYMELSFAFGYLPKERIKKILTTHPADFLLFGTDSPWMSQQETLNAVKELGLGTELEEKILHKNAERLLEL
ncbi:MAG: amidohydrolase family protein [Anaerohalosphaeraceae bacterium]|nr:amidohydrolase family protein [Anaerohalosphaeraceae bacterium]